MTLKAIRNTLIFYGIIILCATIAMSIFLGQHKPAPKAIEVPKKSEPIYTISVNAAMDTGEVEEQWDTILTISGCPVSPPAPKKPVSSVRLKNGIAGDVMGFDTTRPLGGLYNFILPDTAHIGIGGIMFHNTILDTSRIFQIDDGGTIYFVSPGDPMIVQDSTENMLSRSADGSWQWHGDLKKALEAFYQIYLQTNERQIKLLRDRDSLQERIDALLRL